MPTQNDGLMAGKVCMVTGATSGIGEVTALELARMGAEVIVVGRSQERCAATLAKIRRQTGSTKTAYLLADLSSQAQIRALAAQFQANHASLDVLVNNAGAFFIRRKLSVDGIEMTFALNHLNYFLLTNLLEGTLKRNAPARVVNVASGAHNGQLLDFDDLQAEGFYWGLRAYGRSKFANILFTYELARRLGGSGVTANAVHPGWVATNIGKNNGWIFHLLMPLAQRSARSPLEGARTVVMLASSPQVAGVSGKYFYKGEAIPSDPATYNQQDAQRLWEISREMTGLAADETA
jgi:NAD(P)-dependent dehydrogenase (short-subunit alcohol dehydrogenase family)